MAAKKADYSIRRQFDSVSNEIDESELQYNKHDLHECVTGD
jgi:hypothetical protein